MKHAVWQTASDFTEKRTLYVVVFLSSSCWWIDRL